MITYEEIVANAIEMRGVEQAEEYFMDIPPGMVEHITSMEEFRHSADDDRIGVIAGLSVRVKQ